VKQFFLVAVSFGIIPLLNKTKIHLGAKIFITALVISILNGLAPDVIFGNFLRIFKNTASVEVILVVGIVGIINAIMNEYGLLNKIVSDLSAIIKNARILFILMPALVGFLMVPGGAIMSAPFVMNLGEQVGMPKPRRAAVNLIYRHMSMFIMPYASGNLLVQAFFPEISIYKFIGVNSIFLLAMWIFSYFFYLRDVPVEKADNVDKANKVDKNASAARKEISAKIKNLAVNLSPIYAGVVLNLLTGFRFSVCLTASMVILYFLGPKKGFFKLLFKSIGPNLILTMVAIFFVQETVLSLEGLISFFSSMFYSEAYSLLAILFATVFFGMITGLSMVPLGIVLPLIASLGLSENETLTYVYFVFCTAFCGYFFSPLHMCQILTNDYIGVKIDELWKEYRFFALFVIVFLGISFFALRLVFAFLS